MSVDEQLEINPTTDTDASLVDATLDALSNSTPNVKTFCQS